MCQSASARPTFLQCLVVQKVTPLSTNINIVPYELQTTRCLYFFLANLAFSINYSRFKCKQFIQKHFYNSLKTPVFLHMQIVNQTAFIIE